MTAQGYVLYITRLFATAKLNTVLTSFHQLSHEKDIFITLSTFSPKGKYIFSDEKLALNSPAASTSWAQSQYAYAQLCNR